MSMIGNLFKVTKNDLDEILNDPSILEDKISTEGLPESDHLDLDKSWDGIFYLVTGHGLAQVQAVEPPLLWVLFSGQFVDEEQDLGYGPAQYITAEQVKSLNIELAKISSDEFAKRFDGQKMIEAEIYPNVWDEKGTCDYLVNYFNDLKTFYRTAETEGKAVISFIN